MNYKFCLLKAGVCICIVWNSVRKMCPFSPFIYLFSYLYHEYFVRGIIIKYCYHLFLQKLFHFWWLVGSFRLLLNPFEISHPFFFKLLLAFWPYRILQTYLIFFLPHPRISHFSWELWLLVLENGIQKIKSDCKRACCYWDSTCRLSLRTDL